MLQQKRTKLKLVYSDSGRGYTGLAAGAADSKWAPGAGPPALRPGSGRAITDFRVLTHRWCVRADCRRPGRPPATPLAAARRSRPSRAPGPRTSSQVQVQVAAKFNSVKKPRRDEQTPDRDSAPGPDPAAGPSAAPSPSQLEPLLEARYPRH